MKKARNLVNRYEKCIILWKDCVANFLLHKDLELKKQFTTRLRNRFTKFVEYYIDLFSIGNDQALGFKFHFLFHTIDFMEAFRTLPWRYTEQNVENCVLLWKRNTSSIYNLKGTKLQIKGREYWNETCLTHDLLI